MEPRPAEAFREQVCLSLLREAQNVDGGWGYKRGKRSAVEATAWALLTLSCVPSARDVSVAIQSATHWLRSAQLADGSWPAYMGLSEGCWVTALACLALDRQGAARDAVSGGVDWLCRTWPAEGTVWRRLLVKLAGGGKVTRLDTSLRGWSWTPGTSSWVEPTALGLMLLRQAYPSGAPSSVAKRQELAEAMLYNRMCLGGGWNSGNPEVYGVAGEPLVGPTVWALLALRGHRDRPEVQQSLDWLSSARETIQTPCSLALAHLCLTAYERSVPSPMEQLESAYGRNEFLGSVLVAAWCALALADPADWLRSLHSKEIV